MPWIRSKAHKGENRGKRSMEIPPTQISPPGAFTWTAIQCKRDINSLWHSHFVTVIHPNSLTDMPESIYSTSNVKLNITDCDREIILEKLWHGTKPKQTQVEMIAGDIYSRCFGCCCSNWGPTATQTHVPSSAVLLVRARVQTVTQDYLMLQLGPRCRLTAGCSYTCIFVEWCSVPTPPCNGMAWSSLTMRLCATALQGPGWGWLQDRAQRIWARSLGTGADRSLTHVPLWLYLKLTWHTHLAQTRMTGKDNCTANALQITVGRSFIRIKYSLWKAVCCRGQHVQN